MLTRHLIVLVGVGLAWLPGCAGPPADGAATDRHAPSEPLDDRAAMGARARAGIEKYRSKCGGMVGPTAAEVRAWFSSDAEDPTTPVQALAEGLRDPAPGIRADAACLLGCLGDEAGCTILAGALADVEPRVRLAACRALSWLKPGETVQPALLMLCRDDPSIEVQVAAARALGSNDEDVVAAFQRGLAGQNEDLREECENALERLGKLTLPLPAKVYREISREEYEQWLRAGKVERQATKDDVVYFEVVERGGVRPPPGAMCALGLVRHWYRTYAK